VIERAERTKADDWAASNEVISEEGHSRPGRASGKSGHVRCALIQRIIDLHLATFLLALSPLYSLTAFSPDDLTTPIFDSPRLSHGGAA
jgi:hypothetical protein